MGEAPVRVHLRGTREEKIETARRIKAELAEHFPEMVELHAGLVALGMCDGTMADIGIVKTPMLVYNKYQDNPGHLNAKFHVEPFITEEITHAVQDRSRQQIESARPVRDFGRGNRRR